jgi:adenine-specific DNA-methyltransferase
MIALRHGVYAPVLPVSKDRVRYIGNKTKLVPFLLDALRELDLAPGIACDPFAGTASVGRALKTAGWRVHCGDLLALSYAFQVARVELDRTPSFPRSLVRADGSRGSTSYAAVLRELEGLPRKPGFVTEHYTPDGSAGRRHGRMYYTPGNAAAIDTIRTTIKRWAEEGRIDRQREQLLVATLIQAADRVANTTGVYASFVKSWQPNAVKTLHLRPLRPAVPPDPAAGGCTAFLGSAEALVRHAGTVDLLYLDPPYNERQYPGYYHLPELLAQGWDPPPQLRGKTGLIPDEDLRSDWCRRGRCETELASILDAADARHILLSYNDEGLLSPRAIEESFRAAGAPDTFRRFGRGYRRYRSDSDRPGRRYRGDAVRERLYYVRRDG